MTILQKHLVFIPLCLAAFVALFGWLVMMLWNWLLPELLGLPNITFCQAAGLLVLCKILFGGLGCGHHAHGHGAHHCCSNKLREHWETLSPQERERIIEAHRKGCGMTETQNDGR